LDDEVHRGGDTLSDHEGNDLDRKPGKPLRRQELEQNAEQTDLQRKGQSVRLTTARKRRLTVLRGRSSGG
jgi:hypothetical protein